VPLVQKGLLFFFKENYSLTWWLEEITLGAICAGKAWCFHWSDQKRINGRKDV